MIEEFPFTIRVLQAEEDIHSLRRLIDMHTKAVKDKLASLTWARLTWEQRITLSRTIGVVANQDKDDKTIYYYAGNGIIVGCETLSQMQF